MRLTLPRWMEVFTATTETLKSFSMALAISLLLAALSTRKLYWWWSSRA